MKKLIIIALPFLIIALSCAHAPKLAPSPAPTPEPKPQAKAYFSKQDIIDKFNEETGFAFLEEAQTVDFSQSELSGGGSVKKFSLFLSEDDIYSILAQKPPFSSEWTKSEIYRDYQDEWLNLQKLQLERYPKSYADIVSKSKPLAEKGFISLTGSLNKSGGKLKMMCVNIDYNSIVFYIIQAPR